MIAKLKSSQILLWGHVIAFLIVLLMSLSFGVSDGAKLCVGFIVAYAIPALLSKWLMKSWSHSFAWVLLIVALIMSFGITQNINGFLSEGGTINSPHLRADLYTDWYRDFTAAVDLIQGDFDGNVNLGYPLILSLLFKIFGINGITPLLLSMSCMLCVIPISASISELLLQKKDKNTLFLAAILVSSISNVVMFSTMMMKEAIVTLGVSMFGYSLAMAYKNEKITKLAVIAGLIATVILVVSKPPIGYFLLVGAIILLFKLKSSKLLFLQFVVLSGLIILGTEIFRHMQTTPINAFDNSSEMTKGMFIATIPENYLDILGGYYSNTIKRILILPLACVAQYLVPFPWNFTIGLDIVPFYWYGHLSFGWYFVGGSIIGFYVLQWFRKSGRGLNRWALWWILCYMGVAYYSAGTVARYYLPFIPLGVPIALHFIYSIKNGLIAMKTAKLYWIIYITLLVIALAVSYWFLEIR